MPNPGSSGRGRTTAVAVIFVAWFIMTMVQARHAGTNDGLGGVLGGKD